MSKRMTLLARKEGLSTSDFRAYWAGPHAALALGMDGIERYTHNRIDKILWSTGEWLSLSVDGIVELRFRNDEAMRGAQTSSIGSRHIPADEAHFLHGWTLCIVDTHGREATLPDLPVKVLLACRSKAPSRPVIERAISGHASKHGLRVSFNWTRATARRERLQCEPSPPDAFVALWFSSVAAAHDAFVSDELRAMLSSLLEGAVAYLVDELEIR